MPNAFLCKPRKDAHLHMYTCTLHFHCIPSHHYLYVQCAQFVCVCVRACVRVRLCVCVPFVYVLALIRIFVLVLTELCSFEGTVLTANCSLVWHFRAVIMFSVPSLRSTVSCTSCLFSVPPQVQGNGTFKLRRRLCHVSVPCCSLVPPYTA